MTSLRRYERWDVDTLSRRILQRVSFQIGDSQLRSVDRPDCGTERLLVATLEVGNGLQTYSIAAAADDAGSCLQPAKQLARTGWLAQIEASGADGESDREGMIVGLGRTRESGAGRHSCDADAGFGVAEGVIRVHGDLRKGVTWSAVTLSAGTL
jgi:hypothetical protein